MANHPFRKLIYGILPVFMWPAIFFSALRQCGNDFLRRRRVHPKTAFYVSKVALIGFWQ